MTTAKSEPLLTVQERVELGKAARTRCPRASHASWDPPSNRPDPIGLLEAQAKTRVPELVPIRYGGMLASPFAFYRGAAAIMASDLAAMPNTGLHVQLCGDAHLSNFGGFASPERDLVLDLNDFDETLAEFAVAYADQNQRDYQALIDAVRGGRIKAETGV